MSDFWSWWIIIIVAIMIVGSFLLLHFTRRMDDTGEETTGHVFDGIEEYNNPMPKWWLNMFYITLVFGIIYFALYPGLGKYEGYFNWSQESAWAEEKDAAEKLYGPVFAQYQNTPIPELIKDEQALDIGKRIFLNVCFACHGSDAAGSPGYPNLTDNDWLYGDTPDIIKTSIMEGRAGVMPAFTDPDPAKSKLDEEQITFLTSYVKSLSGAKAPEHEVKAGAPLFQQHCTMCHGDDGKGNQIMGAPNLTDNIWLYSGSRKVIARTIRNGRQGNMPPHKDILGDAKVHLVAAYVYSLRNDNQ